MVLYDNDEEDTYDKNLVLGMVVLRIDGRHSNIEYI